MVHPVLCDSVKTLISSVTKDTTVVGEGPYTRDKKYRLRVDHFILLSLVPIIFTMYVKEWI